MTKDADWGETVAALMDDFDALDEWEERYRRLIALGRAMAPLAPEERVDANRVAGCASRVWLVANAEDSAAAAAATGAPRLWFRGESDALIVQGLVALLTAACSGRPAEDILALDVGALMRRLELGERLSPQRTNGFAALTARVMDYARAARDAAPSLPPAPPSAS